MVTCCVYRCSNSPRTTTGLGFHRFPKHPWRFKIWTTRVFGEIRLPTKETRICDIHFTSDDFVTSKSGKRFLKKTAVPSRCLSNLVTLVSKALKKETNCLISGNSSLEHDYCLNLANMPKFGKNQEIAPNNQKPNDVPVLRRSRKPKETILSETADVLSSDKENCSLEELTPDNDVHLTDVKEESFVLDNGEVVWVPMAKHFVELEESECSTKVNSCESEIKMGFGEDDMQPECSPATPTPATIRLPLVRFQDEEDEDSRDNGRRESSFSAWLRGGAPKGPKKNKKHWSGAEETEASMAYITYSNDDKVDKLKKEVSMLKAKARYFRRRLHMQKMALASVIFGKTNLHLERDGQIWSEATLRKAIGLRFGGHEFSEETAWSS